MPKKKTSPTSLAVSIEASFAEVFELIESARLRAFQAVNTELVDLYWKIGAYISNKLATAEWGEGVVERLAQHLARRVPGLRAFPCKTCGECVSFRRLQRRRKSLATDERFALDP